MANLAIKKIECFIEKYMDGDMSQKETVIDLINGELYAGNCSGYAESVGLTYEEENCLMFEDTMKRGTIRTLLQRAKKQIVDISEKREKAIMADFRKLHYMFNDIDFSKVVGKFESEDAMWGMVDDFENTICDAMEMAKKDSGYAGFYLYCNMRDLEKIQNIVNNK